MRPAFGSRNESWTLTRCAVLCVVAANVRERVVERLAPAVRAVDGVLDPYPLDVAVSVPPAGAGAPTGVVVEVVGRGSSGAGAERVGGGDVRTGGSCTGGAVVDGGGGTVGTVTVGAGREGTVGVVVVGTGSVGTGSDGTVTVGTGTSIALPACTSACAAAKPPSATTRRISLPSQIKPQTSDQQSAAITPGAGK